MMRRSFISRVHLFSTLLPTNLVKTPELISVEQMSKIRGAVEEAKPFLGKSANLLSALEMCTDISGNKQKRIQEALENSITQLRSELTKNGVTDPYHRLQIHEAIMAVGFYQRAANPNVLHGEGTRFVLNHFNFDIRRDTVITNTVHDSVLPSRKPTPESEKLLTDLFLLERKLFGKYRLMPTAGKQWFCLGASLEEFAKTEADIQRLMELPPVKAVGEFVVNKLDREEDMWFNMELTPKDEPCFITARDLQATYKAAETKFVLRINKPPKPLTFWERMRERLLRYWVIWLSCWICFFMVDEEIIALTSLIVLKWKQTRSMNAEAEKTGEKVYIARARG